MKTRQRLIAFGILLLAVFLCKFTYLFASKIWRGDLYYYMEFARTMLDGGVLYKNFGCSHPPFGYLEFYWIAKIFGYTNFYPAIRFCAFVISLLTTFLVYLSCEKLFGTRKGILCGIFFIALTTSTKGFWPHNIPLTFMLPAMAGLYLLIRDDFKPKALTWLLFGFFVSCATLVSTNVVFYALIAPIISFENHRTKIKYIIRDSAIAFAGFMIPIAGMALYFSLHNALSDWYFWNVQWATIYEGYKAWYVRVWHFFYGLIRTWETIPFFIVAGYGAYKAFKNRNQKDNLYVIFILAAFITAILSKIVMNKSVERYNMYMFPGLFFVALYGFQMAKGKLLKFFVVGMTLFLLAGLIRGNITGWVYPYDNFINRHTELINVITETVPADKTIYVWDTGREIYFETKRKRSVNSFFSPSEFLDKSRLWKDQNYNGTALMWTRFLTEFKTNPPDYIVDYTDNFDQIDWEKSDGQREGIHKLYYDKFHAYVSANYKEIRKVPGQGRILIRVTK